MRTVHLYGSLGEQFGNQFRLDVSSLAETAQALGCQIPGFRAAFERGIYSVTCGPSQDEGLELDESLIKFGLPAGDIHIVPVPQGSGGAQGRGAGKLIAGVLVAAATSWMGGPAILVSLGVSTALAGVSSLLSPKKKDEKQRKSYMFDSVDNNIDQGDPVPVAIGRCMVSGLPISTGVTVADSNGYW